MIPNVVCLPLCLATAAFLATPFYSRIFVRHLRSGSTLRAEMMGGALILAAFNAAALVPGTPELMRELAVALTVVATVFAAWLLIRFRITTQPMPQTRTILAVGAHPDDLELACGGTLAKMIDQGHQVYGLVMSSGNVGGVRTERKAEAARAGNFIGIKDLKVLNFPDTELAAHNTAMVNSIEAVINEIKPDVVFTHSNSDQHQDHHAVHMATLRAARRQPTILCFESPSTTRAFNPSVYVDIQNYMDIKVKAVQTHQGQMAKPYMSAGHVTGMAAFRGSQAKRQYAEAFEPVRFLGSAMGDL
ncbi:PIG-L deacetylase family protein [Pseudarthrobacter sp. J1763]|uniref:PIG-L deacetylase family protein n=1 Tax=Pseudarthrobacter sp. J1763 TaxID=3420445 RepID=UPI003D2A9361